MGWDGVRDLAGALVPHGGSAFFRLVDAIPACVSLAIDLFLFQTDFGGFKRL
jgi:hypothetical protein